MFSLLSGLAFLAGSFLLLKLATFFWKRSHLPPGPFPFPVLGNLWQLNFQLHPDTLFQLAQTYGSMFTVWLGSTPIVVLNGFQAVKEALVSNSEQFSGRPLTPFFRDLFGEKGIICSNGHTWRQQRRFCLTTLRELGLGKQMLETQLQHEAAELVKVFHQEQDHSSSFPVVKQYSKDFRPQKTYILPEIQVVVVHTVNPNTWDAEAGGSLEFEDSLVYRVPIVRSTTRVIGALVFGHHILSEEPIFLELIQAINLGLTFVSTIWRRLYDMFPWALRYISGPHQRIFQHHAAVRSFICHEIIRHKLRASEAPKDFVNCYLSQVTKVMDDPASTFNEENLIQVVIDLFLGGTDTTATTLHWALIYLVHHKAIQERVQQELDEVLGASQAICYEDRERLPYTRAVLHEVQRFSSVVAVGAVRQCVTSTWMHGYYVPKGTIVLPNLASVLCDPECWETPQEFNPGHFLDKDGNFVANEAFLPFSAGHRVCPGEQLARMELFLMFATLLRTFRFQLPEESQGLRLGYVFGGTLQPQPQKICAVLRLSSLSPREGGL